MRLSTVWRNLGRAGMFSALLALFLAGCSQQELSDSQQDDLDPGAQNQNGQPPDMDDPSTTPSAPADDDTIVHTVDEIQNATWMVIAPG